MAEMRFVNLTPHTINVVNEEGVNVLEVAASGQQARVNSSCEVVDTVSGVSVVKTTYGAVDGLPVPEEGVIYIVSVLVAQVAAGRTDVVAPDTGPQSVVRDAEGKILGVKRFMRF